MVIGFHRILLYRKAFDESLSVTGHRTKASKCSVTSLQSFLRISIHCHQNLVLLARFMTPCCTIKKQTVIGTATKFSKPILFICCCTSFTESISKFDTNTVHWSTCFFGTFTSDTTPNNSIFMKVTVYCLHLLISLANGNALVIINRISTL